MTRAAVPILPPKMSWPFENSVLVYISEFAAVNVVTQTGAQVFSEDEFSTRLKLHGRAPNNGLLTVLRSKTDWRVVVH